MEYMELRKPVSSNYPPVGYHGITRTPGRTLQYQRWVNGWILRFSRTYADAARPVGA